MAVNSKNKGNTFERKIANILSDRFKEHTGIAKSFRRDVTSGSFFGATNQKRLETHDAETATFGDIMAPATFKFSIECKHYKDAPSFLSILKQDNKTLDKWLGQAEQDADNAGKQALVIAKFNNVPEMAFVKRDVWDRSADLYYKGFAIVLFDHFLETETSFFFD
jgi:hypothetical protein